ncbi:MAG: YifB family Mg chelatase-like AAA ATPase [Candidatus Liptonbacteria bacterium]|nr:YifB family Mg chelatase-like AAA ATPase [Candidatus Liptonbacteria bacterium]
MDSFSKVYAAELDGIDAKLIDVEIDINVGLHAFNIVGLADKALSEAKERVNSALKNSDLKPPNKENRKIIVNLAPADVKKAGSQYDLAIAIGYALATKQIRNFETRDKIFVGELALNGELRPISGGLNISEMAAKSNFKYVFLPKENAEEAAVISEIKVIPATSLKEIVGFLENPERISGLQTKLRGRKRSDHHIKFGDIKGQGNAKRAMAIAAAGGHNLLMIGPPGSGKSLMAEAMISILPNLALEEAIEITKIYSAAGLNKEGLMQKRPFRAPHHTASAISIIGGGSNPRPGEISLAHRGILFLDELPEFPRNILESLRQPLESGKVHISRAKASLIFPARFTLIAAMNPCPCGYFGDTDIECRCTANEVFRYQKKISGPLLDRIDMQITVPRIKTDELLGKNDGDNSPDIAATIERARGAQAMRFKNWKRPIYANSEMSSKECDANINLANDAENFLKKLLEENFISARGYYRILKTARTIADLAESDSVKKEHLAEAFGYRIRQKE